jgi:hypothetical protein
MPVMTAKSDERIIIMAQQVKKSEHSGSKKGRGAYWGRKKDAKTESNRLRRETDKNEEKPVSEKDEI